MLNREKTCNVTNCGKRVYATNLCRNHYARKNRTGSTLKVREKRLANAFCCVRDCKQKVTRISLTGRKYCQFHYKRWIAKTGRPISSPRGNKGDLNPRWNGGVSEYKDHYTMKKIRKELIEKMGGKCEVCGGIGNIAHHKDGSKENHPLNNFVLCCKNCHLGTFHSKYAKLYGKSSIKLAIELGVSISTIQLWHRLGKLHEAIVKSSATVK